MGNLIIVSILPILIVITTYLFNLSTNEIVNFKYGLNSDFFKPVGILVLIISTFSMILVLYLTIGDSEFKAAFPGGIMIVLMAVYSYLYWIFAKKKGNIFRTSSTYEPNNKKAYLYIILGISMLMFVSMLIFWYSYKSLAVEMKQFVLGGANKKVMKNFITLVEEYPSIIFGMFFGIINWLLTIIGAGYLYNYSVLFAFTKYKIIFTHDLKDILGVKNRDFVYAYILVETKDNITIKVCEKEQPAITIKKEYIRSVLNCDEKIDQKEKEKVSKEIKGIPKKKYFFFMGILMGLLTQEIISLFKIYKISEFVMSFIIGVIIIIVMDKLKGLYWKKAVEYCYTVIMKVLFSFLYLIFGFGIGTILIKLEILTVSRFVGLFSGLVLTTLLLKIKRRCILCGNI